MAGNPDRRAAASGCLLHLAQPLYPVPRLRPYADDHEAQLQKGARGFGTSFQAFATSAAARVGTGNIAGVAVAVTAGGPGAVFWMWIVAWLGMATSFVENTLAQTYKERGEEHGTFRGAPAYYIEKGLGRQWKWLSVCFSIFLVICSGFFFNAVQSNAMASAIHGARVAYSGKSENFALLWNMADMSMGFMASTNLLAILLLSGVAFKVLGDYEEQRARGIAEPVFDARKYDIEGVEHDVWNGGSGTRSGN